MRILWITNMVLPELAKELNIPLGNSGTWMFDIAKRLDADPEVVFAVACVNGIQFDKTQVGNTLYYRLPGNGKDMMFYNSQFAGYWEKIIADFHPDIVNIHGTEYCHALSFLRSFSEIKTVISLQGVLTRIKDKDYGGLSYSELIRNRTLREWLHFNGMIENHLLHKKNSKSEQEMLRSVKYCMAVDDWHYSIAKAINPELIMFKIHYNLRDEFYNSAKWSIDSINRYQITTNPGGTALKGIHILLKAVSLLKADYPSIKVLVPGMKADKNGLVVSNGYSKYLKKLIKKLGLENHVVFLGAQTAEEMQNNMLHSHIQVVPSSIEGPSLVLHEGMHLGVPSIATFRGGMADFVDDKINGFLYDFDEYQYLALRIKQIFDSDELAVYLSNNAIKKAEENHDREKNYHDYLEMFKQIMKG